MADVVLFRMKLVVISLMVSVGLVGLGLRSVNVGWQWWLSFVMVDVLLLFRCLLLLFFVLMGVGS